MEVTEADLAQRSTVKKNLGTGPSVIALEHRAWQGLIVFPLEVNGKTIMGVTEADLP